MISRSSPPRWWTSSCAGRRPPASRRTPAPALAAVGVGAGRQDDGGPHPLRHLLPLGRHLPEARPPQVQADGAWRDISSAEFQPRGGGAVARPPRAGRGEGRPGGHPLREPARVGLRRPRPPSALGAVDVPIYADPHPAPGPLHPERQPGQGAASSRTPPRPRRSRRSAPRPTTCATSSAWSRGAVEGTLPLESCAPRGGAALAAGPAKRCARRAAEVKPDDLATIIYTSGTTGEPKGVMLTHDNLVSNVLACVEVVRRAGPRATCALSFLPLCHIFERMAGHYLMLWTGRDHRLRGERREGARRTCARCGPPSCCSVPRLYEKMYARVNEKVAARPPARQKIFRWAIAVGREVVPCTRSTAPTPGLPR